MIILNTRTIYMLVKVYRTTFHFMSRHVFLIVLCEVMMSLCQISGKSLSVYSHSNGRYWNWYFIEAEKDHFLKRKKFGNVL